MYKTPVRIIEEAIENKILVRGQEISDRHQLLDKTVVHSIKYL
ncbi:MAG: hypothetical protein QNJ54_28405 [Prochloraceae cyanobacterium]|nr:hypothetical protein [Prochloraceae cyanobacterium]